MTEEQKCAAEVSEPPHYIYRHRCGRPAKGIRLMTSWSLALNGRVEAPVCGIHLRSKNAPWLFEARR